MAITTFSGPVASQNGFQSGTVTSEIAVTTASNVSSSYVSAQITTCAYRVWCNYQPRLP